ncbi:unnamed protein product [Rhodiola kirilowii]
MNLEIEALERNYTWTITPLPAGKTVVDCKWIFKIKLKSDGTVERYKARLVARGFTQIEGLDYHDTFAPVAKMNTVRCLLAIDAFKSWPLFQLDVDNAFLHGQLDEEVYMKLPPGFYDSAKSSGHVCRLLNSLYGLKQASRQWFEKLSEALISFGFRQSLFDYSLFILQGSDHTIFLLVYVDDIVITGTSVDVITTVKQFIHAKFKLKDLGLLRFFLGLEVARGPKGIQLNQRKYDVDLLEDQQMTECKPACTPMDTKHFLSLSKVELLSDPMVYRRLVGKLIYLTITRPDLSYVVHVLSQFMHSPTVVIYVQHIESCGTLRLLLHKVCFSLQITLLILWHFVMLIGGACPVTRRSITGFCILLGGCLVSWKTKKQAVVSRSSAESEYRAMAMACCELVWLAELLADLGVPPPRPIPLFCDNQAALYIARNPVFHERTKHIEMDCHFIRQHVVSKFIRTCHISTLQQPADMLTKALSADRIAQLSSNLGVSNFLHSPD